MARLLDPKKRDDILRMFKEHNGWLRQADLMAAGYHPRWFSRLTAEGAIERVRKGLYHVSSPPKSPHQSLLDACRAVPEGVVCLLSALAFYELTTANPPEVYLAIGRKARAPRVQYPPIRFFHFAPRMLETGVETVSLPEGTIRIFDEEKTLCDSIRHRVVVGQDVASEALRRYVRRKHREIDRLLAYSRIARVEKKLRAYLEALL